MGGRGGAFGGEVIGLQVLMVQLIKSNILPATKSDMVNKLWYVFFQNFAILTHPV